MENSHPETLPADDTPTMPSLPERDDDAVPHRPTVAETIADNSGIVEIDLDEGTTFNVTLNQTVTIGEAPTEEQPPQSSFEWPAPEPLGNATLASAYSKDLGVEWDELSTTIALPADTAARTFNYGEQNPHAVDQVDTEEGEHWAEVISNGIGNGSFQDNLLPAAKRVGADYHNRIIPEGGKPLTIATPRFKDDEGPLMSGERAMLRVNALLGRGAIMQVPLWHSGFWITLKSPSEIELLDALQQISDNKVLFGRSTNGLTFANHVVVSTEAILDLAMRNIYETSVKGFNTAEKVRGAISALDVQMITWGLACAVYPKGFQFERSLLDKNGLKTPVVKELLNVGTCLFTDRNSLNDWQLKHMSSRATASMSEASLAIYRDHFTRGKAQIAMLDTEVGITLKVPSIDQYLNAGQRWVDELVNSVSQAFAQDLSDKQRNGMIYDRAKATSMRQYAHWIASIDTPRIGKSIVDVPTIEMTLSNMSGDDTVRNKFYEVVQAYINDSIVSLVGVPQVHPEEAAQVLPRFENIIPLDPIAVFFNLLYQKIQQIRQRP